MRVLLITQLFDPENAIKGLSFAKGLIARGHQVDVITTFPNYPGGKIYPGYRMRWLQKELIDGVTVFRVPMYVSHDRSALKRLLGYASFSFCALFYGLVKVRRPDVIYTYHPPVAGGIAAALLGMLERRPFIYDVQDLWPEAVVATGMVRSTRLAAVIEMLAGWIYRRAKAVVVLSDGYRQALVAKGVPSEKVVRVYNWCDEARLHTSAADPAPESTWFDIVYAGNLGSAQALEHVIEAARVLRDHGQDKIRFILIGDGVEKERLKAKVEALQLENVLFKPRVPPEEIGKYLNAAGALLVHLAADPVFSITVPSKTQAYLAAGRPLLMGVGGESADIVRRSGAGVVVRPCDPEDIARGAIELASKTREELARIGLAGARFYDEYMSQRNGVDRVSEIVNKVADDGR